MAKRFLTSAAILILYILIVGLVTFYVKDFTNPKLSYEMTNQQIIDTYNYGDEASYAKGGRDIYEQGWFKNNGGGLITLWPPGMFFLHASGMTMLGEDAQLGLFFSLVYTALWGLLLLLLHKAARYSFSPLVAFTLPLTLLLVPTFSQLVLKDVILFADSIGIWGLLAGVTAAYLAGVEKRYSWAIAAGILFAISCYFRSQMELIMRVLTLAVIVLYLVDRFVAPLRSFVERYFSKEAIMLLVVMVVAFHAVTIPWRAHNQVAFGTIKWVSVETLVGLNAWNPSAAAFVEVSGGNLACKIDPEKCVRMREAWDAFPSYAVTGGMMFDEMLITFLEHPIAWTQEKSKIFINAWIVGTPGGSKVEAAILALLALVPFLLLWLSRKRNSRERSILLFIYSFFLIAVVVTNLLVLIMPRYLIPVKMFIVVVATLSFLEYRRIFARKDGGSDIRPIDRENLDG